MSTPITPPFTNLNLPIMPTYITVSPTITGQYATNITASTAQYLKGTLYSPITFPIITFNKPSGGEIVQIKADGTVVWADDIDIDAAVEAMTTAFTITAEQKAAITERVKQDMIDKVFGEIIALVESTEHKRITAKELTMFHEAAKIMNKLKG